MLYFDWLKEMFKVKIFIAPVYDGAPEIQKELKWSRLYVIFLIILQENWKKCNVLRSGVF